MVVDSETLLFPSGTYLADLWGMKEELVAFIKIALSGRTPKIDDHGLKASPLCLYGGANGSPKQMRMSPAYRYPPPY